MSGILTFDEFTEKCKENDGEVKVYKDYAICEIVEFHEFKEMVDFINKKDGADNPNYGYHVVNEELFYDYFEKIEFSFKRNEKILKLERQYDNPMEDLFETLKERTEEKGIKDGEKINKISMKIFEKWEGRYPKTETHDDKNIRIELGYDERYDSEEIYVSISKKLHSGENIDKLIDDLTHEAEKQHEKVMDNFWDDLYKSIEEHKRK